MLRLPRAFLRHRVGRIGAPLVAATMALTVLAGCAQEEPEPKFEAEPTVEPSTPAATTSPEKETVKEFLVRWAEVEAEMQNTGKTKEYAVLSTGCEPCEELVKQVEEIYGSGGFIRSKPMEVERVKPMKDSDLYYVWATVAPTTYRESATAPEGSFDGGERLYRIGVRRTGETYGVTSLVKMPR